VYHFDAALNSSIKMPAYFDDTLIFYEWSRSEIYEVKLDQSGEILKINRFAPNIEVDHPMDMELGPDGALYVLEWGSQNGAFNGNNPDAQLVRIEFRGNPEIASADFDDNGLTDGADFLRWQRGVGKADGATRGDGDANADGAVNDEDLVVWESAFGSGGGVGVALESNANPAMDVAVDTAIFGGSGPYGLSHFDSIPYQLSSRNRAAFSPGVRGDLAADGEKLFQAAPERTAKVSGHSEGDGVTESRLLKETGTTRSPPASGESAADSELQSIEIAFDDFAA
jgi:hypothetical protein